MVVSGDVAQLHSQLHEAQSLVHAVPFRFLMVLFQFQLPS